MSSFANSLSRSSGFIGFSVVGSSGGESDSGRSAWILYHNVGISSGLNVTKCFGFSFFLAIVFSLSCTF